MSEVAPAQQLNSLLAESGLEPLPVELAARFEQYLRLLLHWNTRLNLTAIRDPDAILSRHFLESIVCARALPAGISTLLDFGSGAGFPGIPIALCRPEIAVTLAESQGKKAAFLQEAIRTLGISARVHAARAESLTVQFDCVTLRAVDRMELAIQTAGRLVTASGRLAIMASTAELPKLETAAGPSFYWQDPTLLPLSDDRLLVLGKHVAAE
jgi:16S rRNA (guanine527-N7)-methyltransferase